jgi:hypothetical protein
MPTEGVELLSNQIFSAISDARPALHQVVPEKSFNPEDQNRGFDAFMNLCGIQQPWDMTAATASGLRNSIPKIGLKEAVSWVSGLFRNKPEVLIRLINENPASDPSIESLINLYTESVGSPVDVNILPDTPQATMFIDLTTMFAQEAQNRAVQAGELDITILNTPERIAQNQAERIARTMNTLGLDPDLVMQNEDQIGLMADIIEAYSEKMTILQNYIIQEFSVLGLDDLANRQAVLLTKLKKQQGVDFYWNQFIMCLKRL